MKNHILFIHIPKTAGTSFRLAAKKYLGEINTFYDYGPSIETSKEIHRCIYKEQDMYELSKSFSKHDRLFLSGHYGVAKYASLFETLNIITFVRNPVEQVLSHYKHYTSHHGYKDDLSTFIKDKRFKNIQSRLLGVKPIELYGFIGLTEKYNKSVELINDCYGLDIKIIKTNENLIKELTSDTLNEDIVELIETENQEDIKLYEKVRKIFNERVSCHTENKPYTNLLIQEKTNNKITGCAFQKKSDEAIEIDIYNKEEYLSTVVAKEYRPGLIRQRVPRKGYIGFDYEWEKNRCNASNIRCVVKSTKQSSL